MTAGEWKETNTPYKSDHGCPPPMRHSQSDAERAAWTKEELNALKKPRPFTLQHERDPNPDGHLTRLGTLISVAIRLEQMIKSFQCRIEGISDAEIPEVQAESGLGGVIRRLEESLYNCCKMMDELDRKL